MNYKELKASIEAILFAAGDSVHVTRLCEVFSENRKSIETVLSSMEEEYSGDDSRGIHLISLDDKVQIATKPEFGDIVSSVLEQRKSPTLSPSSLEVLSIAAYKQPVTRAVIEQIRGVDSVYTLTSLLEKGILEEAGRLDVPGRPILYRTSELFLRIFGLASLSDLPPLPDSAEDAQLTLLGGFTPPAPPKT